jgi:putative acetyltransferase
VKRFRIHEFAHAYLPEMADLWIESWSRAYPDIDFEARRIWICERLEELRAAGVETYFALDTGNGTMAGWITLDRGSGHIDQIAVLPKYWGTGAADALLKAVMAKAHGAITLEVNQDNARAIGFYMRHSFVKTGEGVNPNSGKAISYLEWRADKR